MRLTAIGLVLLLTIGCKTAHIGRHVDSCDSKSQQSCQPSCKPDERKEKPGPTVERAAPAETRNAVVTQDILLIPRMVYVPYAPQTPIGPARLGVTASGRIEDGGPRSAPPPPEDKAPREGPPPKDDPKKDAQICDALEKCCKTIEMLNLRISAIEERAKNVPCPTPVIAPRTPLLPRNRQPNCEPAWGPTCDPAISLPRP